MGKDETVLTRRETLSGLGGASALALSAGSLGGCAPQVGKDSISANAQAISGPDAVLEDIGYRMLAHEPARATGLGVDTGEYADWRGAFSTPGLEGREKYQATLKDLREKARAFPKEGLTPDQTTSFQVVESAFTNALDGMDLPYGDVAVGSWRNAPYVVIQNVGAYIDLPRFMSSSQPVKSEEDIYYYLNRLSQIPAVMDGETERMQQARGLGVIPPDFLLDKAITQMESSIKDASTGGIYTSALTSQIVENFGEDALGEKGEYAYGIVTGDVVPALQRQLEELKAQRALAKSDAGIWAQPNGEEWYTWANKASTTTTLSADEIHEQGLDELAQLHARMEPILQEIGYTKGTVGERMQALSEDPRYQFAPGDKGRAEIMAFIGEQVDYIKAQMPRAFTQLVDPPFEVRRIPVSEELGAPGAYGGGGSKDGSIPGRFWINLRDTDLHRKYDLPDLTFHEAIPGHVWEAAYSNRLPLIRSILAFNAFSEGWALYAEQLADELGAYDEFKVGRLGYLQALAFRACRLVVDTGLHHKRWTRQQARNFFVERNGSKEQEVASEVDRYCSWPGQACGYKIGHSEIVRHRARAQAALGDAYDFKAFNTAVILGGNSPLDVVDKTVDRYIAGAKT
ncbi:MAG: DUF885 domain-containing protein [Pseudomonadota bacterium]